MRAAVFCIMLYRGAKMRLLIPMSFLFAAWSETGFFGRPFQQGQYWSAYRRVICGMTYSFISTESYKKRARRFAKQHPELKEQYRKTLQLLSQTPFHPALRLHALKEKLADLHSVSINLSYRITIEMIISEKEIILVNVGSHDEVYQGWSVYRLPFFHSDGSG